MSTVILDCLQTDYNNPMCGHPLEPNPMSHFPSPVMTIVMLMCMASMSVGSMCCGVRDGLRGGLRRVCCDAFQPSIRGQYGDSLGVRLLGHLDLRNRSLPGVQRHLCLVRLDPARSDQTDGCLPCLPERSALHVPLHR